MSAWSLSPEEHRRERFWRSKPQDPTRAHAKAGIPYYSRGRGRDRVLMPDDFMPVGEHTGKHLRSVPTDYLLWVNAQPWAAHWPAWAPVADYLSRFAAELIEPELIVDSPSPEGSADTPVRSGSGPGPSTINSNPPSTPVPALFHCLPGHEDRLHAFALGALGLDRRWYQSGKGVSLPHYDLTAARHAQALTHQATGSVQLVTDQQMILHKDTWQQFFRSKPNYHEIAPTHEVTPSRFASRTPFQRLSPQSGKFCTTTKEQLTAEAAASRVAAAHAKPGGHPDVNPHYLRAYPCSACGSWHLTTNRTSHLD